MPGDNVLSGIFHFPIAGRFPNWVHNPLISHPVANVAYVRMPDGQGFITILEPFHNGNNPNVQGYRCFIKSPSHTVFAAFLENNNNALHFAGNSRVFVRILGQPNPIYSGFLHLADGHPPAWLL